MCLIVRELPTSISAGLIVKGTKILSKNGFLGYETYYFGKRIPSNGWLFPHKHSNRSEFYYDKEIDGGFIHCLNGFENANVNLFNFRILRNCYAFCVAAYGLGDDLISRAIYIPECDTTGRSDELKIKHLLSIKDLRWKRVLKEFPKLRVAMKYYLEQF